MVVSCSDTGLVQKPVDPVVDSGPSLHMYVTEQWRSLLTHVLENRAHGFEKYSKEIGRTQNDVCLV